MTTQRPTSKNRGPGRKTARAAVAAALLLEPVVPVLAAGIDNTATSTGTYNSSTVTSPTSSANVPVTASNPQIDITAKSVSAGPTIAAGTDAAFSDAGDTITYSYTIQNTGNVTLTSVFPVDPGPTFNGQAGTGSWAGAFSPASATLLPGATQTYTRTWTLSDNDVYNAATIPSTGASLVSNTATARGTSPSAATINSATAASIPANQSKTATAKIDGFGKLQLTKVALLNDVAPLNATADLNETITYTYKVKNIGNAFVTNVKVSDVHGDVAHGGPVTYTELTTPAIGNEALQGGAPFAGSTDATANDGIYSNLAPGAEVWFTLTHTVTQAEINGG